jgi:hypothetical protein
MSSVPYRCVSPDLARLSEPPPRSARSSTRPAAFATSSIEEHCTPISEPANGVLRPDRQPAWTRGNKRSCKIKARLDHVPACLNLL